MYNTVYSREYSFLINMVKITVKANIMKISWQNYKSILIFIFIKALKVIRNKGLNIMV